MKLLIVLAAFVAVATCWSIPSEDELANHWQRFKVEHGKNYANEVEETYRMKIFKENAIKVAKHNARFDAGEVSFTVAINKYADLHTHEVTQKLNGHRSPVSKPVRAVRKVSSPLRSSNESIDWRTGGYVSEVKDQGDCLSDYAFSAAGAFESAVMIATNESISLSAQYLIDCSLGNYGCDGGWIDNALYYIKNAGIPTEESYPYTGVTGRCKYSGENNIATSMGDFGYLNNHEEDLQAAVTEYGPVSVSVDGSNWSFQMYSGGIYYEPDCNSDYVSLGALVVGFGSEGPDQDYWIVKNSAGTAWGEEGYIRMARNKNNHCGIASLATYVEM